MVSEESQQMGTMEMPLRRLSRGTDPSLHSQLKVEAGDH